MMFVCLSSTLQFIGALYVTIVFDNILFRRFWAPDYYSILQKEITSFHLPLTKELNNWMTRHIKYKSHIFQENSRKRGAIFLFTTIVMLVSIGVYDNNDTSLLTPFGILLVLSYLTAVVMPWLLHRWIWLITALIIELTIYIVTINYQPLCLSTEGYLLKIRLCIVLLLIFPICYQIIRSWSYSSAMYCFVIERLTTIRDNYLKAKQAINEKDQSLIPECYVRAFSQMAFDTPDKDVQLTQINEQLLKELQKFFDNISFAKLFAAYWKNPKNEDIDMSINLVDENDSVSQFKVHQSNFTDIKNIEDCVAEYEKIKKNKPSIESFCKEHQIDIETFRGYRKAKRSRK